MQNLCMYAAQKKKFRDIIPKEIGMKPNRLKPTVGYTCFMLSHVFLGT